MFYLLIIYIAIFTLGTLCLFIAEFLFVEPEKRDPVQDDLSARIGDAGVHPRV
jgi:hypothetical protein